MILQDYLLLIIYLVLLVLTSLIISRYYFRLRELDNNFKDSEYIIQNIITELRGRAKAQDNKLLDHEVKIEILELKIEKKLSKEYNVISYNNNKEKTFNKDENIEIIKHSEKITDTELNVLNYLTEKDYSVKELQIIINRTREHTARILQKLNISGLIERSEQRPYRYKIKK